MKKLKNLIKEEIRRLLEMEEDELTGGRLNISVKATGGMTYDDIKPGGKYYKWAEHMKQAALTLQKLTKNKIKFIKIEPYSVYNGPYAEITINGRSDKLWSYGPNKKEIYYIGGLELSGSLDLIARAINGDYNVAAYTKKIGDVIRKY